jgi:DNA polymerase elongation subunit (family B)
MMTTKGYLLDVYPNNEHNLMTSWLKTKKGATRISEKFYPRFYVYSCHEQLKDLADSLKFISSIENLEFKYRRVDLVDPKIYKVLEITMTEYKELREVAGMIDKKGNYSRFQLFNVDLRLSQKYMFDKSVFPLAHVSYDPVQSYKLLDDQISKSYQIPDFDAVELETDIAAKRAFATYDDPLRKVYLTPMTNYIDERCIDNSDRRIVLETGDNDEQALMKALVDTVRIIDPDIIYTTGGDKFVMPYLYHRAEVNDLGDEFQLGRETEDRLGSAAGSHRGKSYFTYGQIKYKPPFHALKGRIHLDKTSSFMFSASGLYGLVEIARLSGIPLQTISRLSPGSAISAMQISQAMQDGLLIKWKKNMPEGFKSARDLLNADRGGHTFEPYVGVHENVIELDFTSLYPNIIVKKNISPETVLCDCCGPDSDSGLPLKLVPSIGYHICRNKKGLIPRVIEEVIARRIEYKRLRAAENDMYDQRQKVLKWLLVTCFGYTGYRNARFGRIECHESITAYSRDILLDSMEFAEDMGYSVLHGIVDSLWLAAEENGYENKSRAEIRDGYEKLCSKISERIGIPLELEGVYKWIAFLTNKGTEVGALTRYYGLLDTGEFKVRGLELRQRNTPVLFAEFQKDVLKVFSKAGNKTELHELLPGAIDVVKEYAARILDGECDPSDLVITTRVSRTLERYKVFNDQVAALELMRREGVEVNPGESVRYIILDHSSKKPEGRVKIAELVNENEKYDRHRYFELLLRTGESILRPFGYTEAKLQEALHTTRQKKLEASC